MNADEIKNILLTELHNYYKTIMINGSWGVGKTYYIREYLEDKKHVYISLFGKNNIDEVKRELYSGICIKGLEFIGKGYDFIQQMLSGSYLGVNLSLPKRKGNIEKNISSRLKKQSSKENDSIILVFDDLERKGSKLPIEEILGLVEELSKIDNIKIVVVTNEYEMTKKVEKPKKGKQASQKNNSDDSDQSATETYQILEEKELYLYNKFKEKVIQKTFNINKYSKDAPENIINVKKIFSDESIISTESFNSLIKEFLDLHKLSNLRTLEKSIPFIKEVFDNIDITILKHDDTVDIIKACLAILTELNEHIYDDEVERLDKTSVFYEAYTSLSGRVLKYYFKSDILISLRRPLIELLCSIYYDYDKAENFIKINDYYKNIYSDNNEKPLELFYRSEKDMIDYINNFVKKSVNIFNPEYTINTFIKELESINDYVEVLNLTSSMKKSKIIKRLKDYANKLNYANKTVYELTRNVDFHFVRSKSVVEYVKIATDIINEVYYKKFFETLKLEIANETYNSSKLELLSNYFGTANKTDEKIYKYIKQELLKNNFFILNVNEEISENIWHWNHTLWGIMSRLNGVFEEIQNNFRKHTKEEIKNATDIGKYRLNSLNDQYHIEKKEEKKLPN